MSVDPVSLAIMAALTAGQMALTASQKIEGPRLTDLDVTVADYGTPLNYFYGTRRLEVPVFYAEPIRETKTRNKTKGGKYNEYKYTGTFAVVVADHGIDKYNRVWLDRRLAYDASDPGAIEESLDAGDYMRFYYGTETQEPDERMLATIEANEGAGTCPAYRGVSYIMFEELPLQPFGNRFPQISVEALSNSIDIYPVETIDGVSNGERLWNGTFSHDGNKFFVSTGSMFSIFDLENLEISRQGTLPVGIDLARHVGWYEDGRILAVSGGNDLVTFYDDGLDAIVETNAFPGSNNQQEAVWVIKDGDGFEHWMTEPFSFVSVYYVDGVRYDTVTEFGFQFSMGDYCRDQYGDIWGIGRLIGPFFSTNRMHLVRVVDVSNRVVDNFQTIIVANSGSSTEVGIVYNTAENQFVCRWNDRLYAIDDTTFAIKSFADFSAFDVWVSTKQLSNMISPDDKIFIGPPAGSTITEISLRDLSITRTINLSLWGGESIASAIYDQELNAILTFPTVGNTMTIRYLDQARADDVLLSDIIAEVATRVDLDPGDYDVSTLDQVIEGYSWSQGAGKEIIAPLLQLHDSFMRPNGFQIEGLKRGRGVEGDTVSYKHFVREDSDDGADLYEIEVVSDSDLPRRISATFADLTAEQQPNTAIAQRATQSVITRREISIDITTLALSPDVAQPLVERVLRRPWIGSVRGRQVLPPYLMEILPGDVREFRYDDDNLIRVFITSTNLRPNRTMEVRWERDFASASRLRDSPGAIALGRPTPSVFNPVESEGFVIDTGLLRDVDDATTPYVLTAAGPERDGDWPGADLLVSASGTEGTFDPGFDLFTSVEGVEWGIIEGGNYEAAEGVPDRETELTFATKSSLSLVSATEEELIADPTLNLAIWGAPGRWEIVQFATADLQSDGDWLVNPRLRGLRGTERFISEHELGDRFVLFSNAIHRRDMGASKIGITDYYKALTTGLLDTSNTAITVAYASEALRPLSVAQLSIERDALTGTVTVAWNRRTRIGGSSIDGQDVPLGETSELYNVRVLDGAGDTVRSTQVTVETFEYDAYDQITDFGSEQASVTIEVAQVSPTLNLEGVATQATG